VTAPRCDMLLPHFEDFTECTERSRYRLERAPGNDHVDMNGWSPAEACPRHLPEMLFDLAGGDDVQITVTLHYDEQERTEEAGQ
jgi:hypothetical protein